MGESSMTTHKTHFEQIPVATVKRIARRIPASDVIEDDSSGTSSKGWRGVAQQVLAEPNPDRMLALVQELIEKYDEEQLPIRPKMQLL
jgi:hypothetical protein